MPFFEESIEMTKTSAGCDGFDPSAVTTVKSRSVLWIRVLRRLDAGGRAVPGGEAYAVGSQSVPAAVIRDLARHDLIEPAAPPGGASAGKVAAKDQDRAQTVNPVYVISAPGRSFVRRMAAASGGATSRVKGGGNGSRRQAGAARGLRRVHAVGVETPNEFRAQHQILETGAGTAHHVASTADGAPVLVNRAESPLGWLRHRKDRNGKPFLSEAQVEAGEELRKDFEIAGMTPRMTTDLSGRPAGEKYAFGNRGLNATERQIAAKQRLDRAIAAVGPNLSDVVVRVCCFLEGIEAAERALGWPTRSGKLVLGIALDRLARHYGFA
jgi:hypothetical protein